jgi:hypothetical protein
MGKEIDEIESIAYHRNGISGVGFHVVAFETPDSNDTMIAIVFPGRGRVAVLNGDLAVRGRRGGGPEIRMGENSWRGDRFEPELREAIKEWEKKGGNYPKLPK